MVLRNFLYLDTNILNDYLSTLEGYIEESAELTENKYTKTSGKAGVRFFEGERESNKDVGIVKKVALTDASKFQKLYEILEKKEMIQFLEVFDSIIWDSIKKNEILEVPSIIKVPDMYKAMNAVGNITPFIGLIKAFGKSDLIDEQTIDAINGIKSISDLNEDRDIPVILELVTTKKYVFTTKLKPDYLKCDINKLEGEINIIGKVQKIIPSGVTHEVFSMVSGLDSLMSMQNREERRKYEKSKTDTNISDLVKGPAIVLIPLAIFR
jgi:hypothetical protein